MSSLVPSWGPLLPSGRVGSVTTGAGPGRELSTDTFRKHVAQVMAGMPAVPRVIVACEDRLKFVVAAAAAWARGAEVCLPPRLQVAAVEQLRTDIAAAVLRDADIVWSQDAAAAHDVAALDQPLAPGQPMARVFTSGSTGEPCELPKLAGQLLGEAAGLIETFGIGTSDRVLALVPPHHIYGLLFGVVVPLLAGATMVVESPLYPEAVAQCIRQFEVTHLVTSPAQLRALSVLDAGALSGLTRVFSSAAPLAPQTAAMIRSRFGVSVTEIFGSSETGGVAWRLHDRDDSVYRCFAGVQVSCADDGRMLVDSPLLGPDMQRPWLASDRIALVGDGFVHLGRVDDVVKVAGRRVSITEVEARLRSIEGVDDAAVLAQSARDGRGEVLAAVVASQVHTEAQLRGELCKWFDDVIVPRRIAVVESLPREPTGKIGRARLVELLEGPEDLSLTRLTDADDTRRFSIAVPHELRWFRGHFPGKPVLPGVVELERIALPGVAALWPELGAPRRVLRLKFTRVIAPGAVLELRLRRAKPDRVDFDLREGEEACASGTLVFGAGAS